ncbi:MAG: AAA family ATPase [Defluviitaleaceae bacterium]|nr:AAA family ATPase [Defluviitaleaceae bacterium]MCL2263441.1 AAA family ATPase [Defluviitaleaceae bacterium]
MDLIQKHRNIIGVLVIIAATVGILYAAHIRGIEQPKFMEYTAFISALEEGNVSSVTIGDGAMFFFTISENEFTTNNPRREDFKEFLLINGVYVTEQSHSDINFLQVGFTIAMVAGVLLFVQRKNSAARAAGGLNPVMVSAGESGGDGKLCGFNDVAGNLEAKESVQDIVDYLREPEKFTRYGARMPRGILFHGKPGTGKTLMARAMAGEAGVPFYAVSGSDFVQMYVGVGAARVRDLFKKAREAGRGVIFIDEIDALGKKRSDGINGNDEREQTLNALLTEMQGFSEDAGIVVVAATNRPDTLDEALMRPGRFDRRVEIGLPDINARRQILQLHAKGKPLDGIDIEKLAADTVFFSGAMLEGLLNDAAINAARNGSENISQDDITSAYYTALAGSEKKDRSHIRQHEREITAYHESGHAVAAILTNPENRVAKVTIIPSTSGAGGFCVNIPPERMYYTKQELRQQIMVSLAGRCAEELRFGADNVTTGGSNDIEKATTTAMQYITKFGMGTTIADRSILKDDKHVADECNQLLTDLYEQTRKLLQKNLCGLKSIAEELLTKETLDGDRVKALLKM